MIKDERGIMLFAFIGVVVLLLSIYAGAYFAAVRMESRKDLIDVGEISKVERELERIENELNSAAQEAGLKAVEEVREDFTDEHSLLSLKRSVEERTVERFENYFEEHHSEGEEIQGMDFSLNLRPLKENENGIELSSIYLQDGVENESGWKEVPAFFTVERTVNAHVEDPSLGVISTRTLDVKSEVRTDLFLLAERTRQFDLAEIRKMVDCMLSTYLNARLFSDAVDGEIGFKEDFSGSFSTGWIEDYFQSYEKTSSEYRKEPWVENSTGFIEGFERDKGNLIPDSLISESDFVAIIESAILIEQIRIFRSHDGALLSSVADHFGIEEDRLSEVIGTGENNAVNLQNLILTLFQEKGSLPEKVFLPEMFLRGMVEEDLLSVIEKSESWTNVSFGMINELVRGEVEGENNREYREFEDDLVPIEDPYGSNSYLRVLFSIFGNAMDDILKSFRVDSTEVEGYVFEELKSFYPISWMDSIEIIGEPGVEKIVKSILHRTSNLSMSFGFDEGSYETVSFPFYYMYFLNDWGFTEERSTGRDPISEIDREGIERGVRDKIKAELRSRSEDLEESFKTKYSQATEMIAGFNGTDWYEPSDEIQQEVWQSLNETLDPFSSLSEDPTFEFSDDGPPYITEELEEHHEGLKKRIEEVEESSSELSEEPKEYTKTIVEMQKNYTANRWRQEGNAYLYGLELSEDFFNRTDHLLTSPADELSHPYNWSFSSFSLEDHIDPPRKTDQSIGERALGNFTDEMVRERITPTPMEFEGPRGLFRLLNENLFQLTNSRKEDVESRLRSIISGEGDPYSDNLGPDRFSDLKVELVNGPVSSKQRENLERWPFKVSMEETIVGLEEVGFGLEELADELTSEEIGDDFKAYSDASFYRTAERIIGSLINRMEEFKEMILSAEKITGFYNSRDETSTRTPVVHLPRSALTFHELPERSAEVRSYTLGLDVDMSFEGDLVELNLRNDTTTRVYPRETEKAYEWTNPFSDKYSDHYRTTLFQEYSLKGFEIEIGPGKGTPFSSKRYSSSRLTTSFEKTEHRTFVEAVTPQPVLDRGYTPRSPSSPLVENISFGKNVFNGSEEEVSVSFDVLEEDFKEQEIHLELIKRDDLFSSPIMKRGKHVNLDHLYNEETSADPDQEILAEKSIFLNDTGRKDIGLDIELSDKDYKGHFSLRMRSGLEITYMEGKRDMEQTSPSEKEFHSPVPFVSVSEQIYISEDERIGSEVFRKEGETYDFDLIDQIPQDSWIINKDGFDHLIDFEDNRAVREVFSGLYRGPLANDTFEDVRFDPVLEFDGNSDINIPNGSEYGRLLNTDLIPLYMGVGGKSAVPVGMIPHEIEENGWQRSFESFLDEPHLFDLETEEGFFFRQDIDSYHGSGRVNTSFQQVINSFEDIDHPGWMDLSRPGSDGIELLREAGLIDEFSEANRNGRKDLLLAACYAPDRIDTVRELAGDSFELGPVARSLDILGEEDTSTLLDWIKDERAEDRSSELMAFTSFERKMLRNLTDGSDTEDLQEALYELDDRLEGMDFADARYRCIENLDDIQAQSDLSDELDGDILSKAAVYGMRPSALKELIEKKSMDAEILIDSMRTFSDSPDLQTLIDEMNAGNYQRVPSLYAAGTIDGEGMELFPFGEERPYLMVNDKMVHAEITTEDSISELKEHLDITLRKVSDELPSERIEVMIFATNISFEEDASEKLRSYAAEKAEYHDPRYQNISRVSFILEENREVRYFHL